MNHINDELLNEYLDEQLDAATQERVNAHLTGCDECRERLVEARLLFTALAELPDVSLGVDLSRRVVARISAEFKPQPIPRWTIPVSFLQLLVVLMAGVWLWPAIQPAVETARQALPKTAGQLLPELSLLAAVESLSSGLERLAEIGEAVGPNPPLPVMEGFIILGLALILWLAGSGLVLRQSLIMQHKS